MTSQICAALTTGAARTRAAAVGGGNILVHRRETGDADCFILRGGVGVGYIKGAEHVILNNLCKGDSFGGVAVPTGISLEANMLTEHVSESLIIPVKVMRRPAADFADLKEMCNAKIVERRSVTDLDMVPGWIKDSCGSCIQFSRDCSSRSIP